MDSYKTILAPSEGLYKEKGSKFLAFAFPVSSENEFKEIQSKIEKQYHDARHRCFAFQIGVEDRISRANDDGEPSHSAGQPILNQIQSRELTNVLVYVVRYFGGTLLGVGGLIKSYKTATSEALDKAKIVKKNIRDIFQIQFPYEAMGEVMRLINTGQLEQYGQDFRESCSLKIKVDKSKATRARKMFEEMKNISIFYLGTE